MIFWPFRLAFRVLFSFFSVLVIYFGVTFVQIWQTGRHHATNDAQAILVFGTTEDNGHPSPELKARLDHALVLWRSHRATWMVVTGGNRPGDHFTEAGVSATYLEAHGVNPQLILKGYGNDTWQNVSTVIAQMRKHHLVTVLCVSDPFHEDRAMAIASAQGLDPYPSPVDGSAAVQHSLWFYYLKETVAVGVGRLVGYGQLSTWTTGATTISVPSFGG